MISSKAFNVFSILFDDMNSHLVSFAVLYSVFCSHGKSQDCFLSKKSVPASNLHCDNCSSNFRSLCLDDFLFLSEEDGFKQVALVDGTTKVNKVEEVGESSTSQPVKESHEHDNPSFIVGGEPVHISGAPSYAFITASTSNGTQSCSGNIISDKHVLTAAHCVTIEVIVQGSEDYTVCRPSDLTMRIGSTYSSKGGRIVGVQRIDVHPFYGKDSHLHGYRDLAVITIRGVIAYDSNASPALVHSPLNEAQLGNIVGTKCSVAGWGKTEETKDSKPPLDQLHQISVTLVSVSTCKMYYLDKVDSKVHICTQEMGKSGCHGDSGGGLFCAGKILGVVSWGDTCTGAKPVVYARVDNAEDFLLSVLTSSDHANDFAKATTLFG